MQWKAGDIGMYNVLISNVAEQGIESLAQSLRRCPNTPFTASSLNEASCHASAPTNLTCTPFGERSRISAEDTLPSEKKADPSC